MDFPSVQNWIIDFYLTCRENQKVYICNTRQLATWGKEKKRISLNYQRTEKRENLLLLTSLGIQLKYEAPVRDLHEMSPDPERAFMFLTSTSKSINSSYLTLIPTSPCKSYFVYQEIWKVAYCQILQSRNFDNIFTLIILISKKRNLIYFEWWVIF